ncbi:MAG: class I SAM-dependent methyltransferase [Candidatus Paceibacterota bacterium]|jgi:SAM-dependent methyltransferase
MSKQNWDAQHLKYAKADWIDKPTIFAQYAIEFFPTTGRIIDVGCGQGQDSRFFAERGYDVVGIDFSERGINFAKEKNKSFNIDFQVVDISEPLPFQDVSFDVVYSHLAVHYFDKQKTELVFQELSRILKKNGILAIFVNSIHDPEYGTGEKLEEDYFFIGNMQKRYFSKKSLQSYIKGFETLVLNEEGETYKDRAVGVSNLVQFIGRKI